VTSSVDGAGGRDVLCTWAWAPEGGASPLTAPEAGAFSAHGAGGREGVVWAGSSSHSRPAPRAGASPVPPAPFNPTRRPVRCRECGGSPARRPIPGRRGTKKAIPPPKRTPAPASGRTRPRQRPHPPPPTVARPRQRSPRVLMGAWSGTIGPAHPRPHCQWHDGADNTGPPRRPKRHGSHTLCHSSAPIASRLCGFSGEQGLCRLTQP
jgi:hypothetical protein